MALIVGQMNHWTNKFILQDTSEIQILQFMDFSLTEQPL